MRDLQGKKDAEYYEKVLQYSLLDAWKALIKGDKEDLKHEMGIVVDAWEMIKLAK